MYGERRSLSKMASQNGDREGEEVKPGQMELIAVILAGMREEMAHNREAQAARAHEQAKKTDALAKKADEQACHLVEVL